MTSLFGPHIRVDRLRADPAKDLLPSNIPSNPVLGVYRELKSIEVVNGLAYSPSLYKFKAASETVNNSTTLQTDDDLAPIPILVDEIWVIEYTLFISSNATADFKYLIDTPGSDDFSKDRVGHHGLVVGVTDHTGDLNALVVGGGANILGGGTSSRTIFVVAYVDNTDGNGGVSGDVDLNWAQNTADMSNTRVLSGSFVRATRLSPVG